MNSAPPADRDRAPGAAPSAGDADRRALRRWLVLHAALALLCVLLVQAAGRALGRGADEPGDPSLRGELAAARPDVLLLGNSILKDGVNAHLLDELLAGAAPPPRLFKHALGGVYSAYWYLYLKNCVIPAGPPRLLVIPFRDPLLTFATLRIEGSYATTLARAALPVEPEYDTVIARTTAGAGDIGERALAALRRLSPAYAARDMVRDGLFELLKGLPAEVSRGRLPSYASAVGTVLPVRAFAAPEEGGRAPGALDTEAAPGAATEATAGGTPVGVLAAAADADVEHPFGELDSTPESAVFSQLDYLRFERILDASFLPPIVALCHEHGIRLALVRLKKGPSPDWSDLVPPDLLADYQRDVDAWLAAHDVLVLDTSGDEALTVDLFRGADHLNEAGREYFTVRLARWLARWWAQPDAPREQLEQAFRDAPADAAGAPVTALQEWTVPASAAEPVRRGMVKVAVPDWIAADGDTEADPERSRWELFEDGVALGPSHTLLPTIVLFGKGRYAHNGAELYFTASDDTSPRDNGRTYVLRKRVLTLPPAR